MILNESLKYALRSRYMIFREIRHVEWLYSLSADELYAYKNMQFIKIFKRAYRCSPFYHKLYEKEGLNENDVRSLNDIGKLPILTKNMVRRNAESILTVPKCLVNKAETSGTTGSPLTAYHSYKAIRLEQAYNWVRRKQNGFIYGKDRLISLRGNLGSDRFCVYVPVSRTLYLSSYQISDKNVDKYIERIKKFKPTAIEGYPSSLYNLAVAMAAKGATHPVPVAFTSSETLFPFQREVIESVFRTELFDYYGCTERTVAFSEQLDHSGYREEPGYGYTELFDDHIVTTSLINSAFPLIRYRVEDVLRKAADGSVEVVEGRNEDVVVCKDGIKIGRLDHILKGVSGISLAQVIQKVEGKIEIRYVPDATFSDNSISQVEKKLYAKVSRNNIDVKFIEVADGDLIYGARNKFNFVKSYL